MDASVDRLGGHGLGDIGKGNTLTVWGRRYFPEYFNVEQGRHHKWLAEKLSYASRKRGQKFVCIAPRDSAKTVFCSFLAPLYGICMERETYIVLIADTYSQAVKYLKAIKHELETNERLVKDFPWACGKGKEWADDGILTSNGIRVEPLGLGQKIRGRRERINRPSMIVVDDAQDDAIAYSSVQRDHDWEWFTKGVLNAGAPKSNVVVVGTMIHKDCIVGGCLHKLGWPGRIWKSIITWPTNMTYWEKWEDMRADPRAGKKEARNYYLAHQKIMKNGARVLWKQRENLYQLMETRFDSGHAAFEQEKQNNPIDPSKIEWPPHLFEDCWFDEWPANLQFRTMALDPSKGKQDKQSDWQAIVLLGYSDGKYYVEASMKRESITEMVARFAETLKWFKPDVAGIEVNQFQELVARDIKVYCEQNNIPILPLKPISNFTINKNVRIRRISPLIEHRWFKFKAQSSGTRELLAQLQSFPTGDHDDGPDALEMAQRLLNTLFADNNPRTFVKGGFF